MIFSTRFLAKIKRLIVDRRLILFQIICVVLLLLYLSGSTKIVKHSKILRNMPLIGEPSKRHVSGQLYKNGEFCVYPNLTRNYVDASRSIVMTTHSSADYIGDNLVEMAEYWRAPISLAVFSSRQQSNGSAANLYNTHQKILLLLKKSSVLRKNLTLTVFTSSVKKSCPDWEIDDEPILDDNDTARLPRFNEAVKYGRYPINVARNLARLHAPNGRYILFADMDQIYSANAASILYEYATKRELRANKEVLAIRRFEIATRQIPPQTVKDVRVRFGRTVFQFHFALYAWGHRIPHYRNWSRRGDRSRQVEEMIYGVDTASMWEPMLVASVDIPMHNEELVYRTMNNLVLAWELCMHNYKFMVVDAVFSSHRGVKTYKYTNNPNATFPTDV